MSWAADGQDGSGLHLEKVKLIFSSLPLLSWKTHKNYDYGLFPIRKFT